MDRIRKDIIALFNSERLSNTTDTNFIETDFLDVSFKLEMTNVFLSGSWTTPLSTLFRVKPSTSHHQIVPLMTNRHIPNLPRNENEFNKAKPLYELALKNGGFNYIMKFEAHVENARRKRNSKVTLSNPPYSLNVKTNIVKVFLKPGRKYFSWSHKFNKIFNLNTIKISYSSIPNVENLIKQHNLKILSKDQDKIQQSCNYSIKESWLLNGKCLHQCIIYKAEVTINTTYKEYYGV